VHAHQTHLEHVQTTRKVSDFFPLAIVFAVVLLATYLTHVLLSVVTFMDMMRLFMGYFFLIFGAFKVVRLRAFADAYSVYDLIAMRSRAYGYIYPFIELGLALFFLSGRFLLAANVVTLVIMLIGVLGVYLKLQKKEEIPCACLGVVFKIPMTYVTLFEDLLMAGMAASMLFLL
jgi:hypothetical protein